MGQLDNKIVVITGGNSGIGFATAKLFIEEGAKVIITGRNKAKIDLAVRELGNDTIGLIGDLIDVSEIEEMVDQIGQHVDKVDVLFLNAGVALYAPINQITEEFYDKLFDTNVKGLFFMIKHLLPRLGQGSSVILNSSINSFMARPTSSVYAATKAAVSSLTRTLSGELIERGIRLNTVIPGPTQTPIFGKMGLPSDQINQLAKNIKKTVPMDRFGRPEEIAQAALYFASERSAFTVGAELVVDGGMGTLR